MIKTGKSPFHEKGEDIGYVYKFVGYGRKFFAAQHRKELERESYDFLVSKIAPDRLFRFYWQAGEYRLTTEHEDFYRKHGYKIIVFDNGEKLTCRQRTE